MLVDLRSRLASGAWKSEGAAGRGVLALKESDWSVMGPLGSRSASRRLSAMGHGGERSGVLRALNL